MKKLSDLLTHLFIFLLVMVTLSSCDSPISDFVYFDDVVVDDPDNPNKFRQITFIVSLYDTEHGYVNLEQIDSMDIYVNAKFWGCFTSDLRDTEGLTDTIVDGIPYSEKKVNYLFVAPYQLNTESLETAGEFVQYLIDRIVLTPGEYVAEIDQITYTNLDDEAVTHNVQEFSDFTVVENATSSYIGDIEIELN